MCWGQHTDEPLKEHIAVHRSTSSVDFAALGEKMHAIWLLKESHDWQDPTMYMPHNRHYEIRSNLHWMRQVPHTFLSAGRKGGHGASYLTFCKRADVTVNLNQNCVHKGLRKCSPSTAQVLGKYLAKQLASTCQVLAKYSASAWQVLGKYLAYLASTWQVQVLGKYLASTW